jgi:hypothetical protein
MSELFMLIPIAIGVLFPIGFFRLSEYADDKRKERELQLKEMRIAIREREKALEEKKLSIREREKALKEEVEK